MVDDYPDPSVFVQAVADCVNTGVFDSALGRDVNTPHNPFVDDSLMADIRRHILTSMAASIESLFLCMGPLEEKFRRSPLSMDKYSAFPCSWEKVQLGLLINTRKMNITLPSDKMKRLVDTLKNTWHKSRKSFTLLEGVTLLGHLEHACMVCSWGRPLFCALRSAVNDCLRTRIRHMHKTSDLTAMASTIRDAKTDDEKILFDAFLQKKISRSLYQSKEPCFISKELSFELSFLHDVLADPSAYPWECPIAHLVPRSPDFTATGDSSLFAAGGYSLDLKFWWYISWPPDIQSKTLKFFIITKKDPSTGDLISINLLEFAVVIINYAAATHALSLLPPSNRNPFPVLLNRADNMTANKWSLKAATTNLAGRSLSRLFCGLRLNNPLGLNCDFLPGHLNTIADRISRVSSMPGSPPDFTFLSQEFPELASCQRFHPSPELLSCLLQALHSKLGPGIHQPTTLGQMSPERSFTSPRLSQNTN